MKHLIMIIRVLNVSIIIQSFINHHHFSIFIHFIFHLLFVPTTRDFLIIEAIFQLVELIILSFIRDGALIHEMILRQTLATLQRVICSIFFILI